MEAALEQLRPAQKRLIDANAERALAILDRLLARMEMVPLLAAVGQVRDSHLVDSDLRLTIDEFVEAQNTVARLGNPANEHQGSNGPTNPADRTALFVAEQDLRRTTRLLVRQLDQNQNFKALLLAAQNNTNPESASSTTVNAVDLDRVANTVTSLHDMLETRLLTTTEEMSRHKELVQQLATREAVHAKEIDGLEQELAALQVTRDAECQERQVLVDQLEARLETMTQHATEQNKQLLRTTKKRQLEIDSELTSSSEAIAKQIAQVQADLATLRRNNKEIETKLRQRKRRIEAQVEDIIFQYDQDMGHKQLDLDQLNTQHNAELEQMKALQAKFDELEVEYNIIMADRKREREAKQKAEEEMQKMVRAALLVQAMWRAYKARKALAKKSKKGKGKGKKKGK